MAFIDPDEVSTKQRGGFVDPDGGSINVSPDEEGGMIMPTPAQLEARQLRDQKGGIPLPQDTQPSSIANYFLRRAIAGIMPSMPTGNVPAWMRAGESLKMTPEGKASFIRSQDKGSQPPLRGPNGEVMVFDDRTGEYVPFNQPGFDTGDVAGMAGPAVESAINLMKRTPNPIVQGAAAVGGNALRQGISSLIPGDDQMSALDRAKEAGTAGLFAAGAQGAVNTGARAFDFLRPTNIIGRKYQEALNTPEGKQGAGISDRTGGSMDVAEATQDPALLRYRNTALQSDEGQKLAREMNNQQLSEQRRLAENEAQRTRINVTTPRINAEQVGKAIEDITDKETKNLYALRSKNADTNYGDVRNSVKADVPGGKVDIEVSNLQQAMADAEEQFPGITKGLTESKRFMRTAEQGPKSIFSSIDNVLNLESRLRAIKTKGGSLNPKYPDVVQNKMVAGDLHEALVKDLEGTQTQVGKDVYGKLRNAIDAYRSDSDAIRKVAGMKLGDAGTPEGLAESLRTAQPSQLKQLFELADEHDPALRQKTVEYLFRSSIDKAKNRVLSPSGQVPFNRNTFLNEMGIGEEKLNMLTRGQPKVRQAVDDTIELIKRTNKSANMGNAAANVGSDVASGTMVMTNILSGDPKAGVLWGGKFLAKHLTGPVIAKIMFQPEGQTALRTLVSTNPGSKAYMGALGYVARVAGKEPSDREVGQQFPPQE